MNFAEAAKINSSETRTENGAYARNTSGEILLEMYLLICFPLLVLSEKLTKTG